MGFDTQSIAEMAKPRRLNAQSDEMFTFRCWREAAVSQWRDRTRTLHMDARTNQLAFELGQLRSRQRRERTADVAARILAIEAELETVNYQFHAATAH